jgi:D-alanyl-D-alanine carboxypeptidase
MARRLWVIGVVGAAAVALAWVANSSDDTGATEASPAPRSTVAPVSLAPVSTTTTTTTTTTTEPPPPPTNSTSTTVAATTTTTSTTPTTVPRASTRPFDGAAFDAVIAAATVDLGDLGAGAAVMRNGTVLHTAAFGMENPFEAKAATVDSRFRIASVSKMFTAVATMQLVNDGSIDLDKPFTGQLGLPGPFNDPRVAAVTVRQLLSHTSGFGVSRNNFFGHGVNTWQQAAKAALEQPLLFDPGTAFQYSNANFCLLGLLLEAVTGQPFETAIRERVLEPIGIEAHLAPTFDTKAGDVLHASSPGRNYMETLGPAGGWVATPLDVAKLASALRAETPGAHLLDRSTVDAMRVPVPFPVEVPAPANGWSYGLGLLLFGDGSWGHTGTIESTHAVVVNRPDGLTVAVLVSGKFPTNTDDLLGVIDLAVAAGLSVGPATTVGP